MDEKFEPLKSRILPFSSFHKKRIIKDMPSSYIHVSKFNNFSYVSEFGTGIIEIRDKEVNNKLDFIEISKNEYVMLMEDDEEYLYVVTKNIHAKTVKIFKYSKEGKSLIFKDFPYIFEEIDHTCMVNSNNRYIIITTDVCIYSITKNTLEVEQELDNVFKVIEDFFITEKVNGKKNRRIEKQNLLDFKKTPREDRPSHIPINLLVGKTKKEYNLEPLFMDSFNFMQDANDINTIVFCCKNKRLKYNRNRKDISVKNLNIDYFLVIIQYEQTSLQAKHEGNILGVETLDTKLILGKTCKIRMFKMTDNYIPTCIKCFDAIKNNDELTKYISLGIRYDGIDKNDTFLSYIDITKLIDENEVAYQTEVDNFELELYDFNIDISDDSEYKRHFVNFKNANYTCITNDSSYIYAGTETGDIIAFNNNEVSIANDNDNKNRFIINNACNGKIDYIHVNSLYLYSANLNTHDITVYERTDKPVIIESSEKVFSYIDNKEYIINYTGIFKHDDPSIPTQYRILLLVGNEEIELKKWSDYEIGQYERNDSFKISIYDLQSYNCKLVVELKDPNGSIDISEHHLDMLIDKDHRLYTNKIVIPYKTIPDKDFDLEYTIYKMVDHKLVEVDHGEFNVLSTFGTEWQIRVYEHYSYKYDPLTDENIKYAIPHMETVPIKNHRYDYIEIPIPEDTEEKLYFKYTFKSKERDWAETKPSNGEYFIYDMSEFYKVKGISKADGGISVIDKFNLVDRSFHPGMETVNSIIFKVPTECPINEGEEFNRYEMKISNEIVYTPNHDKIEDYNIFDIIEDGTDFREEPNHGVDYKDVDEVKGIVELYPIDFEGHAPSSGSLNVLDSVDLCFKIVKEDRYELAMKAPDGNYWDFDIITTSNGRNYPLTDKRVIFDDDEDPEPTYDIVNSITSPLDDQNLFIYKTKYDLEDMEEMASILANPIKTDVIKPNEVDKYRVTDSYNEYGEPNIFSKITIFEEEIEELYDINADLINSLDSEPVLVPTGEVVEKSVSNTLKYTMDTIDVETFKEHNHHFNIYIDGLKLPNNLITNDVDKIGKYSTTFLYDDTDERYKYKPIEIELMHTNNINSETVTHKVIIESEADIEKLYRGEYVVYIPRLRESLDLSEFNLFVEYPLVNSSYRIDNCNFVIKRDKDNPTKLYIKLKNYILNSIGCTLVITTINPDKQLMFALEGTKEKLADQKPYYYIPLMKYDAYGNLMHYYTDDIKSFTVVVDGYTLMPNVDYVLVNYYLHSHMPTFILFEEVLNPGSNVEITFDGNDVYDVLMLPNNNSDEIILKDGHNMFIENAFSVFVEGKKLRETQYEIVDYTTLRLLVDNYSKVYIKFQYKPYNNMDEFIEVLYSHREELEEIKGKRERKSRTEAKNDVFSNAGIYPTKEEKDKANIDTNVGRLYLIEAYADKYFRDNKDAIFDCNDENELVFDVNLDCDTKFELPYINNDIVIDSNECYDRNDFTLTSMPTEDYLIDDTIKIDVSPKFLDQPILEEFNEENEFALIKFSIIDDKNIFYDYKISVNNAEYIDLIPFETAHIPLSDIDPIFNSINAEIKIADNRAFVYLKNIKSRSSVKFLVSDGVNETESETIAIYNGACPILRKPVSLISPLNSFDAKFLMDVYDSENEDLSISIVVNNGNPKSVKLVDNEISYDFKTKGNYKVKFIITNKSGVSIESNLLQFTLVDNAIAKIKEFVVDNVDHDDKYATMHLVVTDNDTDIKLFDNKVEDDGIGFEVYLNGNKIKCEYNTVKDMIFIYIDNLEPGKYTVSVKLRDGHNETPSDELTFEVMPLDIFKLKDINNVQINKFGDLTFEYEVDTHDSLSLKHEISYNGYKYIEFNPSRYNNKYLFSENVGATVGEITDLKVRITNTAGKELILVYDGIIKIPHNKKIYFYPNIDIEIENGADELTVIIYSVDNTDNDILYGYYSLERYILDENDKIVKLDKQLPWIQAYPVRFEGLGNQYRMVVKDIPKGEYNGIRIKLTDGLTEAISDRARFNL